uniref:Reverse transcriptase domain-containing protein n=1 Tax=Hyaloperonospora arabidopsidis (strain Emoy2) TaxID=559515 RepID=M4BJ90_HYAAE
MLATRSTVSKVIVCGYADDTAVYIRSPTEVGAVLRILEMFGNSFGLTVNVANSIAISLRPGPQPVRPRLVL